MHPLAGVENRGALGIGVLMLAAAMDTFAADSNVITGHQDPSSVVGAPGIRLSAGQDNGTVSLKGAWGHPGLPTTRQQLTLSSPVSKSSDTNTQPATLDGLANATSVQYSFLQAGPWDSQRPDGAIWLWGLGAKVGYQQFTFFDSTTLAKSTVNEYPSSGSLHLGLVPANANLLVLGGFAYQHKYTDATTKVSCPASSGAGPIVCVNGPIGKPTDATARIFSLETRYATSKYNVAPVLSYDTVARVKGVDLPVYLVSGGDKSAALTAGIDIGWRSDTHKGSVGIFVGSPFAFFGSVK